MGKSFLCSLNIVLNFISIRSHWLGMLSCTQVVVSQAVFSENFLAVFLSSELTYLLTYLLSPWNRVLLEKLTGFAANQEIPRILWIRKFITVLTSARHLSLSSANCIQSPQPLATSWRSILILSSHLRLGLPNGLFPSGFPTKTLCTPLPSSIRATCPANLIRLDFITRTIAELLIIIMQGLLGFREL